jgi:hypothetical protein
MTIDWELFFPDVSFDICEDRMSSQMLESDKIKSDWIYYWDPNKDFKSHMEKLKVDLKYFNEKDLSVFPKDFHKPIYSVKRFEESRVELMERIQFDAPEGLSGYDEDGNDIPTWRMSLKAIDKWVDVKPGTIGGVDNKFRLRANKNIISVHRFNMLYLLFDWLLTVNPKGAYRNKWQIFAYGISEYNSTMSYVSTFVEEESDGQLFGKLPVMTIKDITGLVTDTPYVGQTKTADDIRKILNEWNPKIK